MQWRPVTPDVPSDDVLLWIGGRCVVGCLIQGITGSETWRVFMDSRTDDLLPWPSYWMPLPEAPPEMAVAASGLNRIEDSGQSR